MNRTLSAQFERAASDTKARTVQAVLSTETPVNRGGVFEVLIHTSASIDLSRFPLPVIINHDSYNLPIAIAENPKITGGKLRATIRFSENDQATQIFNDVVAGIVTNLSIGYQITNSHQETRDGQEFLIADSWIPYELSTVSIPADPNAGFNKRNFNPTTQDKNMTIDVEKIKNDTLTAERERINNIKLAVRAASLDDSIADKWIADGVSDDAAREQALNMMIERAQATPTHSHGGFDYGSNNDNHLTRAIGDALLMRANIRIENPSPAARDFKHTPIAEIAKIFLERSGASTVGLNQTTILQRAFTTSSDFIGVLDAIQDKALQNAYTIQASTMEAWTTVKDTDFFRDATVVNLGEMPALEQIMEGGEYTYGSVDSIAEKITMLKYGKLFGLSWEALRRDDLATFIQLPEKFGAEAKRTETTLVYKALTSNQTLSDGKAFFDASRGNLSTTPTGLSLGSLSAARAAMRKFKGLGGKQYIDAIPTTLLVPVSLETDAQQLVAAISATKSADVMPDWVQKLQVVADPRLDDVSEKDWYLFCDPNAIEGFTRLHLDGNPVSVTQEEGFEIDGVKFKCRLAMGVGAIDWRAAYKTIGA